MPSKILLRVTAAVTGSLALAVTLTACGGSSSADSKGGGEKVVTVYSADGLKSDKGDGWYDKVFAEFTKKTGIEVKYVEGGSGEMVQRAVREKTNTQADVLVTLPPSSSRPTARDCSRRTSRRARTRSTARTSPRTASGPPSSTTTSASSTTRRSSPRPPRPGRSCWTASSRARSSTPPRASRATARPSSSRPCTTSAARSLRWST